MGVCCNAAAVNIAHNEGDNNIDRKAQQLALEEEMEKLRRKQSHGWEEENDITLGMEHINTGQTKTIDSYDENVYNQLINMGFNEYIIKQAFKYGKNDNLLDLIEWIESHKITKEETENYRINSMCKQLSNTNINCNRLQALHVLNEVITSEEHKKNNDEYIINKCINYVTINGNIFYNNLSNNIKDEYMLKDQILIATIQSIEIERKNSMQWRTNKPFLMAELRTMGFLQTVINNALNSDIKDKKSAIKWIMNNPLTKQEELHAKITEITHSGFTQHDAKIALNKFDNNLSHSLDWLNQSKADKINHFLYHFKTKKVIQIENNNFVLSDISFHNEYQKWSIWNNGKIKNFHWNKIFAIKCIHSNNINIETKNVTKQYIETDDVNETNPFLIGNDNESDVTEVTNSDKTPSNPFEIIVENDENENSFEISEMKHDIEMENDNEIKYEICIVSEDIINNNKCIKYLTNWIIDSDEKIIKMEINNECFLYLVYRDNRFGLDSKYIESQMDQRWCVLSKIELTELNPKELAKELDDPDAECLICFDREPNIILNPCGHNNFCKICIDEYQTNECPICRTNIKSVLYTEAFF
eukprot:270919_1